MRGKVQGGKTCREIGAAKSFKEKVDKNDIWKVHQRAYKKYFARVSKGKMSKPDFEVWARKAERLRKMRWRGTKPHMSRSCGG